MLTGVSGKMGMVPRPGDRRVPVGDADHHPGPDQRHRRRHRPSDREHRAHLHRQRPEQVPACPHASGGKDWEAGAYGPLTKRDLHAAAQLSRPNAGDAGEETCGLTRSACASGSGPASTSWARVASDLGCDPGGPRRRTFARSHRGGTHSRRPEQGRRSLRVAAAGLEVRRTCWARGVTGARCDTGPQLLMTTGPSTSLANAGDSSTSVSVLGASLEDPATLHAEHDVRDTSARPAW